MKPLCLRCAYYFITYDPRFPYGCNAMGFKSRRLPEQEIRSATGESCAVFVPKPSVKRGAT